MLKKVDPGIIRGMRKLPGHPGYKKTKKMYKSEKKGKKM